MTEYVLDNPIWHMLCNDLAEYATGTSLAKHCDPKIVDVAALKNQSKSAFDDLAQLFKSGEMTLLWQAAMVTDMPAFKVFHIGSGDQLVCKQRTPIPESDVEITNLKSSDIPEIVELIELTKPGPLFPGLIDIRNYVGIRQDGKLVAMAGERMKPPGYCEISAVCTHPDWRGNGYARLLSSVIADGIWERGEVPFLHVLAENESAYRVYTKLHFEKRKSMMGFQLTRI